MAATRWGGLAAAAAAPVPRRGGRPQCLPGAPPPVGGCACTLRRRRSPDSAHEGGRRGRETAGRRGWDGDDDGGDHPSRPLRLGLPRGCHPPPTPAFTSSRGGAAATYPGSSAAAAHRRASPPHAAAVAADAATRPRPSPAGCRGSASRDGARGPNCGRRPPGFPPALHRLLGDGGFSPFFFFFFSPLARPRPRGPLPDFFVGRSAPPGGRLPRVRYAEENPGPRFPPARRARAHRACLITPPHHHHTTRAGAFFCRRPALPGLPLSAAADVGARTRGWRPPLAHAAASTLAPPPPCLLPSSPLVHLPTWRIRETPHVYPYPH